MKQNNTVLDTALLEKRKELENSFLNDWKPEQFKIVDKAIVKHFLDTDIHVENTGTRHIVPKLRSTQRVFECIDRILGLAYTSTGLYACYSVCNVSALNDKFQGYRYNCFALSTDKKVYAILWDKEENKIILPL